MGSLVQHSECNFHLALSTLVGSTERRRSICATCSGPDHRRMRRRYAKLRRPHRPRGVGPEHGMYWGVWLRSTTPRRPNDLAFSGRPHARILPGQRPTERLQICRRFACLAPSANKRSRRDQHHGRSGEERRLDSCRAAGCHLRRRTNLLKSPFVQFTPEGPHQMQFSSKCCRITVRPSQGCFAMHSHGRRVLNRQHCCRICHSHIGR